MRKLDGDLAALAISVMFASRMADLSVCASGASFPCDEGNAREKIGLEGLPVFV